MNAHSTKSGAGVGVAEMNLAETPRPRAVEQDPQQIALWVAGAALDKKAIQVEIIDVRGKVDYADFVVVMSGRSDRQVAAIAKNVETELKRQHDVPCNGTEGLQQGHWVLMDFGAVIVHVFHEDRRGFYDLEALWIDAERVELPEELAALDPGSDRPLGY